MYVIVYDFMVGPISRVKGGDGVLGVERGFCITALKANVITPRMIKIIFF